MRRICTVLVIEDDPHIADLIIFLLQNAGYQTVSATNAAQAHAIAEVQALDLVILDWMLPDVPGDRLCRELKSNIARSFLPILMLTARSGLADRVAGLDAGADDFLTKPFHTDELMARVRALLRIRNAELDRLQMIDELRQAYDHLAAAQAQIVQTSRLAALGELVAGVAHELNNPLGIILGNAELLPTQVEFDDQRAVVQIIEGAQRARRIVHSLITFARQGKLEEDWYNPHDLIERVLDLKRAVLHNRGITLDVSYAPQLPMIWADGAQIQQVILNLLMNAEDAVQHVAHPRIQLHIGKSVAMVLAPPIPILPVDHLDGSEPACMIVIDVIDNGTGIDAEIRERLFQPFVTTKPIGQGTGLGLSLAYGIIMQHGGSLQFDSTDAGTQFRIALPITREGMPLAPLPVPEPESVEGGRLLVVGGEVPMLDFVRRLLNRSGWEVELAHGARMALDLLDSRRCDVVLCDVAPPDMSGDTFYTALHERTNAAMPQVIVMAQDVTAAREQAFVRNHHLPLIRTPFTRQELLRALAALPVRSSNRDT